MMHTIRTRALLAGFAASTMLAAPAFAADVTPEAVVKHYADVALAKYQDSLTTAKALDEAIQAFVANPSEETQNAAKEAWIAARIPYQLTEVYRFGNPTVDDWEGKVNAWPLDEGLIDYVDASYGMESDENSLYTANVIANPEIKINGETVDATEITPDLLANTLHEAGEIEANVATGYHAIEFLLWGQDLNGTDAGAGQRSYTDYLSGDDCTNGNCDRRAAYLTAASELLISDLEDIVAAWEQGGEAYSYVTEDPTTGIAAILTGMGSLSYGELAGERMKLGLLLHDPEEEHDCFSDNTHNSHYYDGLGIQNVYLGEYVRVNGDLVSGPALADLVEAADSELNAELTGKLSTTMMKLGRIKTAAEAGFSYDQMLAQGSDAGEALVMGGVDALVDQTRSIERAVAALELDGVAIEGSDSLDNPTAVFE